MHFPTALTAQEGGHFELICINIRESENATPKMYKIAPTRKRCVDIFLLIFPSCGAHLGAAFFSTRP